MPVKLEGKAAQVVYDEVADSLYNGKSITKQQALKRILIWAFDKRNSDK